MKKAAYIIVVIWLCISMFPMTSAWAERAIKKISDLNHQNRDVGSYRALIIAINNYKDPSIPDLKTPLNDAKGLNSVLTSRYGFKTQLLTGKKATRRGIYNALRKLSASAKPDESVLIYYAGHGDLDRQYNDGWWIPYDAKGGDAVTYLDNTEVQKAMRSMQARHVLLVSDSCYSGSLFGSSRSVPPVINDRYYLNLYNEKSRWGMTSGNKEPVSDSGTGGNSVFAYQLIKTLKKNDKPYMTTQELYTEIAPIIGNNSDQTPLCRPVRRTGDQGGQFLFLLASSGAYVDSPIQDGSGQVKGKGSNLSVKANVSGATVYLDGKPVGRGNIDRMGVTPGKHRVRVEKTGYVPYSKQVTVRKGRSISLQAFLDKASDPKGALFVDTSPENARISILNIKPVYYPGIELKQGKYHVKVSAKGYATRKQWVTVASGEDKSVHVRLKKITGGRVSSGSTTNTIGMSFVHIPPGIFVMGSPKGEKGRGQYEKQHEVTLSKGFFMQTTEVTQGQWKAVMGNNPSNFSDCGDDCPVEWISWNDANAFISKLNNLEPGSTYRLPTESEWEYACRAGTKTRFSWGDDGDCRKSNYGNGFSKQCKGINPGKTKPVASFEANPYGLYDMHGNVREMCSDWYGFYPSGAVTDPVGPSMGVHRVNRGGSWDYGDRDCRSAKRNYGASGDRSRYIGFRVVKE